MRFFVILIFVFLVNNPSKALGEDKAYFAGGCFWCVEESFEKLNGVIEVISGYSGGTTENPTYKEVTYGNTGHFEVVEVIYNKDIISFEELLKGYYIFIINDLYNLKVTSISISYLFVCWILCSTTRIS